MSHDDPVYLALAGTIENPAIMDSIVGSGYIPGTFGKEDKELGSYNYDVVSATGNPILIVSAEDYNLYLGSVSTF